MTAVYSPETCVPVDAVGKPVFVVNAVGQAGLLVDVSSPSVAAMFDVFGRPVATLTLSAGLRRLPVAASGFARVSAICDSSAESRENLR